MISTAALTRRYGTITAVAELSVDIPAGITGLIGANGAGKSTLIKMLLGLLPPSAGKAEVLGHDIRTDGVAIRERVGYMPEHDCLPPDMSATELVVHMARMSGLPRAAARERTADTLRHVGLYEERYRPIGGYSTGMKQRVKLAQALVHDPQLIFLDEPTNGLDPTGRDEMLGLIRRIGTEFGISVLVSSHLLGELERTCDHVVVIDGGQLLRSSSTAEITAKGAVLVVEVTERGAEFATELRAQGLEATADGEVVQIGLVDEFTYDAVIAAVNRLDVGLVRLERPRHRMAELFATPAGQS